jgi:hypothetical protein
MAGEQSLVSELNAENNAPLTGVDTPAETTDPGITAANASMKELMKALVLNPEMFSGQLTGGETPQSFKDMRQVQQGGGLTDWMRQNLGLDEPKWGYDDTPLPTSKMAEYMFNSTRPPGTPTGIQPGEQTLGDVQYDQTLIPYKDMLEKPEISALESSMQALADIYSGGDVKRFETENPDMYRNTSNSVLQGLVSYSNNGGRATENWNPEAPGAPAYLTPGRPDVTPFLSGGGVAGQSNTPKNNSSAAEHAAWLASRGY